MAINMSDVIQISRPGPLYKKKVYFSNNSVVYKGTSTPCPIEVTIYSKTPLNTAITASNFYNYLTDCGYEGPVSNRFYLIVDNPYEFVYNNGTYECVFASFESRPSYPVLAWFSVPGAASSSVYSNWTITEDSWQEVGSSYINFIVEYKTYRVTTSGSYTNLTIGKNYTTNEEYIANYCINGVSYPNVTIISVSENTYTLSDQQVLFTNDYSSKIYAAKEIVKIQDTYGNVLWSQVKEGWHTLWEGTGTSSQTVTYRSYGVNYAYMWSGGTPNPSTTLCTLPDDCTQVRITWTATWNGASSAEKRYVTLNGSRTSTQPDSLVTLSQIPAAGSSNYHLLSMSPGTACYSGLVFDANRNIYLEDRCGNSPSNSGGTQWASLTFTVTKIEAYY